MLCKLVRMQRYLTVYILECSDGSFYTGLTNDIDRRLFEHQKGLNTESYTFNRRPVKLVFQEEFEDFDHAYDFERQIKGWRRDKKLALIEGQWDSLKDLAKRSKG